jgi:hypothetical protein
MGNACVDRYLDTILSLFPKTPYFAQFTLNGCVADCPAGLHHAERSPVTTH